MTRFITSKEACKLLGVSRPTFTKLRNEPGFPATYQYTLGFRFKEQDILDFIENYKVRPGKDSRHA